MTDTPTAYLKGSVTNPYLELDFNFSARLPEGHKRAGLSMIEWVRSAPGRRWDPTSKTWHLTATGTKNPDRILAAAGFQIDWGDFDVLSLSELVTPIVKQHKKRTAVAMIRPRFAGYEVVASAVPSATWDKERAMFTVPMSELVDDDGRPVVDFEIVDAEEFCLTAQQLRLANPADARKSVRSAAARAAFESGMDMTAEREQVIETLVELVGDIPDWFGLALRPYQRIGALAAFAGRRLIADPPGVGKTRTGLAAAAMSDAQRVLVVSPPVATIHWGIEASESGLVTHKPVYGHDGTLGTFPDHVRVFLPGRKEPELPDAGVVIVTDSLLTSREHVVNRLIEWEPDVVIVDEIHRCRTWSSARSTTLREFSASLSGAQVYGLTGTPMFSHPANLAGPLAITGQLAPVFGGYDGLVGAYCYKNHFGQYVPKLKKTPELRRRLNADVWVMRNKRDVLPDLPEKTRVGQYVNVPLAGFKEAHKQVVERASEWLEKFARNNKRLPSEKELADYASGSIGLISPLRVAAGLAKVPAAIERISAHVEANVSDGKLTGDPLVVWAHHKDVARALVEASRALPGGISRLVETIDSSDSVTERGRKAAEFQDGNYAVLICSIAAAGVGITLHRAWQQIFVEPSWDAPDQTQAEDRLWRMGQTNGVLCEYLLAAGTLDGRIFSILQRKSALLEQVVPGTDALHIRELDADELEREPSVIIRELVDEAVRKFSKTPAGKRLARSSPALAHV